MTGFGVGEGPVAGGRLQVEIRTVNHRFFNLAAKLPADLGALEAPLRDLLRQDFDRGHVSMALRWLEPPTRDMGLTLNLDRARAAVAMSRSVTACSWAGGGAYRAGLPAAPCTSKLIAVVHRPPARAHEARLLASGRNSHSSPDRRSPMKGLGPLTSLIRQPPSVSGRRHVVSGSASPHNPGFRPRLGAGCC